VLILALAAALAADEDYRSHVDQARFFLRKGWTNDALVELQAATSHPDGRLDPEAWLLLSTTRLAAADVPGATAAAEQALTMARDVDEARQAEELAAWLRSGFGVLVVEGPEGVSARFDLALQSMVFDATAQEIAGNVAASARRKGLVPRRFGLPVGTWQVGDTTAEITPGGTTTLRLADVGAPAAAVVDRAEIELGAGLGAVVARGGTWLPAPTLSTSIGYDLGGVEVGALASLRPATYVRRDLSRETDPLGGSIGVRAGFSVPGIDPWVARVSATAAIAWVPGLELACLSGETFTCERGGPADLVLYARGRGFAPGAALTVGRVARARTFSVGFGVTGSVERVFGAIGSGGTAWLSDGDAVRYTVGASSRPFQATTWGVGGTVFVNL
jgi:hypothetical protein